MIARRLYNEDQILAALNEASRKNAILPATGTFLKELRRRGEPVLFTRDDLLAVASTHHEKLMVHGIFTILDTQLANEQYILAQAKKANLDGNMEIMIRLAKARKEEDFQPGDVVRAGDGTYWKLSADRNWTTFGCTSAVSYHNLRRPLEKM